MRLDPRFRSSIYAVFAVLFITGAGLVLADQMKDASSAGETWQTITAYLLMLHGGAAMGALMLLGALVPLHVQRAWQSQRNRITATAMVTSNAVLVATSFGLYYAGSEVLRPWISNIHIGFGLCLPVLFVVHILVGRRGF